MADGIALIDWQMVDRRSGRGGARLVPGLERRPAAEGPHRDPRALPGRGRVDRRRPRIWRCPAGPGSRRLGSPGRPGDPGRIAATWLAQGARCRAPASRCRPASAPPTTWLVVGPCARGRRPQPLSRPSRAAVIGSAFAATHASRSVARPRVEHVTPRTHARRAWATAQRRLSNSLGLVGIGVERSGDSRRRAPDEPDVGQVEAVVEPLISRAVPSGRPRHRRPPSPGRGRPASGSSGPRVGDDVDVGAADRVQRPLRELRARLAPARRGATRPRSRTGPAARPRSRAAVGADLQLAAVEQPEALRRASPAAPPRPPPPRRTARSARR